MAYLQRLRAIKGMLEVKKDRAGKRNTEHKRNDPIKY